MDFEFGIDVLLASPDTLSELKSSRFVLVAHPASVTKGLKHTLDALIEAGARPHCVFGPQHGARGEKQDNMIESGDYLDPIHQIPIYSLYGAHRRPTDQMLEGIDRLVFDLQDIGCRIYTFLTTLHYLLEAAAERDLSIWILDRPNPAGRQIDGLALEPGHESFVGTAPIPTAHGLTLGEMAHWLNDRFRLDAKLRTVTMRGYDLSSWDCIAWPETQPWVNPSPNASSLNMTRHFAGTVLLEGTELSEGRGTTTPLELVGAPGINSLRLSQALHEKASFALGGTLIRPCHFEPTFHKHAGALCEGLQLHTDHPGYAPQQHLPYTLMAIALKHLRGNIDGPLWRHHEYEYALDRTPIDVIAGTKRLREWVDDPDQDVDQLIDWIEADRRQWEAERAPYLLYGAPPLPSITSRG